MYHLSENKAEEHVGHGLKRSDYQYDMFGNEEVASTGEYKVWRVLENKWVNCLFDAAPSTMAVIHAGGQNRVLQLSCIFYST